MEFHPSKSQVIFMTNKAKTFIGNYQIHDHILVQDHCAKYLGIYIDSKLIIITHVDEIVKKANSTRAFPVIDIPRCCRKVKLMACATYTKPIVEYASPVWDPITKRNFDKIKMVQHSVPAMLLATLIVPAVRLPCLTV